MIDTLSSQQGIRQAGRWQDDLHRFCARLAVPALLWVGGRIRHVNRDARSLLGARNGWVDPLVLQSLRAVVVPGVRVDDPREATVLQADGTLRQLRVFVVPMREGGRPAGIWLLQDLSRERAAWAILQQSHRQLASLSGAGDAEQDRRRRLAAASVHDELLQPLAALQMNLQAALRIVGEQSPPAVGLLQSCADIARIAMGAGREIVRQLGAPMLEELGLAAALESLAGSVADRHGIACSFRARGPDDCLQQPSAEIERCLYRVAEEALAAAAPACRPGGAGMRLAADRHGRLALRIDLRGTDMPALWQALQHAVGLQVLKQRVRILGGCLRLQRQRCGGISIQARLPDHRRPGGAPDMAGMAPDAALTRFFYRAPVGLVQAAIDGTIELMNPSAAGLLLPFSPEDRLDNLLRILAVVAPPVLAQMQALQAADGVVCDGLRIAHGRGPAIWLTVTKQAGARWMVVLGEVPSARRAPAKAQPPAATPG